jgi:hypothetical protein
MKWFQDPRYNKFLEWYRKDDKTKEIIIEKEDYIDDLGNVEYNPEKWMEREKQGWKPRSPWYIKMCQQFNNDEQKIAQELDVSFLGSASNVVAPEFIEMQTNLNVQEPNANYKDPLSEDTWVWQLPIESHRYILSIDCSRGDSADRTALEVLDIDATDENGLPCIEQVLEYHGKKTGDDIGEMAYYYGKMYGNAFIVVDAIGGTGDACLLTLMRLGYTNLYYDDPLLKTYTIQREASSIGVTNDGKLPGFHSSSVRFQMLTHFAHMVKTNQLKIRSKRVITELDTWIYKGDAGRIDHMDGCHDDTLTCLAMGLFVMKFSLEKLQKAKEADATILSAWTTGSHITEVSSVQNTININNNKQYQMPFYNNQNNIDTNYNNHSYCYMWLFT